MPVQHVVGIVQPQVIAAGRPETVELHFQVDRDFHINSHTPRSKTLIATVLELEASPGVRVGVLQYPAGTQYSFSFAPEEKLDVYTGDFTVKAQVTAARGDSTLRGLLRYQACDNAVCYPPRELPVQVRITAK